MKGFLCDALVYTTWFLFSHCNISHYVCISQLFCKHSISVHIHFLNEKEKKPKLVQMYARAVETSELQVDCEDRPVYVR